MPVERGWKARLHYRTDQFLSSGPGKQLLLLFVLTVGVVLLHLVVALILSLPVGDSVGEKFWFYFTRILDTGAMGDDEGWSVRIVSAVDTVMGLVVAGLLISALAGNFQERLDSIKRGGSPVMEKDHFLILGWSDKIYSVIDQLSEANQEKGRNITVVVMAEREKLEMEEKLRLKVQHLKHVKLVVRSGSSVSISDLARVAYDRAQAIIVLVDENDAEDPDRADGRIIKTLLAIYNHPDGFDADKIRVTAEVLSAANQDVAQLASKRRAQVVKTNEMISKIILQTSRISGLSIVYDELLRVEGAEVHYHAVPSASGQRFSDLMLDFPNGCLCGVAKKDGSSHILNPPADYVVQPDEELLILAEDDDIHYQRYAGPLRLENMPEAQPVSGKPVEHMLVLGWNEKIFPIVQEFDNYVGPRSSLTLVNSIETEQRTAAFDAKDVVCKNIQVRHIVGEFTSRKLMEKVEPQQYPTVMVLGDAADPEHTAEQADTRAIIALLLLRDFRSTQGGAIKKQKVCSEILEPKNRELAATTEIHDIVISNEMVSMVLAQITNEPRVAPILEDFFRSEGSEIYLKAMRIYAELGQPITFEELLLRARARNEVALGYQVYVDDASKRYGIVLNPSDRKTPIVPKVGDRLIVLAEDDG
jgi:ion channel POLLUX/CASTOR